MNAWPVSIDGILTPARKKITQYEFQCRDYKIIANLLPLISSNPYKKTVSSVKNKRNTGIPITCIFNKNTVESQFHRGNRIWIGSNYTLAGISATKKWRKFISNFGIIVGKDNNIIPVVLDFYQDLKVVIRLSDKSAPKSSFI
jgi:hypothetical protein